MVIADYQDFQNILVFRVDQMGCIGSVSFVQNDAIPGRDKIAMETFDELNLSQTDLNIFFTAFIDIDADNSGHIRADEFYAYFRIEQTPFNKRLFGSMDTDNTGYLNFCEFVCAMWNFLSMEPSSLGSYAYFLFDDDNTGNLDHEEVKQLVETIQHKSYDKNPAVRKLVDTITIGKSTVSVEHFAKCARDNHSLCGPLISLQQELRKSFIGIPFWNRQTKRRNTSDTQTAPDYIQVVTKQLNEKRLQKQICDLQAKKQAKLEISLKQAKGRSSGRRPTAIMMDYFTPKYVKAPPTNKLPAVQRARRSSILTKPSLVLRDKKVKLPRRAKQRDKKKEGSIVEKDDDCYAEKDDNDEVARDRISSLSKKQNKTTARNNDKGPDQSNPSGAKTKKWNKKSANPKRVIPSTFSDISDFPENTFAEEEKAQSPDPSTKKSEKSGKSKYQLD